MRIFDKNRFLTSVKVYFFVSVVCALILFFLVRAFYLFAITPDMPIYDLSEFLTPESLPDEAKSMFIDKEVLTDTDYLFRFSSVETMDEPGPQTLHGERIEMLGLKEFLDEHDSEVRDFNAVSSQELDYEQDELDIIAEPVIRFNLEPLFESFFPTNFFTFHLFPADTFWRFHFNFPSLDTLSLSVLNFEHIISPLTTEYLQLNPELLVPPVSTYDAPSFQNKYKKMNYAGNDILIDNAYTVKSKSLVADNVGVGAKKNTDENPAVFTLDESELFVNPNAPTESSSDSKYYELIGYEGVGIFNHLSGINVAEKLHIGVLESGVGTYNFYNGDVFAEDLVIGYKGEGHFIQNQNNGTGKLHTENIFLGYEQGSHGTLNLYGDAFDPAQEYNADETDFDIHTHTMFVGRSGTGVVSQYGGAVKIDSILSIGNRSDSESGQSSYTLYDGILDAWIMSVGDFNSGVVNFYNGLIHTEYSFIGLAGQGYMNHFGGLYQSDFLIVGNYEDAYGELNITGDSSEVTIAQTAVVGGYGAGTIEQTAGTFTAHTLSLAVGEHSEAHYIMKGHASADIADVATIGYQGNATLEQWEQSSFSASYLFVGVLDGSDGLIDISGGYLSTEELYLGAYEGAMGTLESSMGASITSGLTFIGYEGFGTFTMSGGQFVSPFLQDGDGGVISGITYVGYSSDGVLDIESGSVYSPYIYVGYNAGASGTIEQSGGYLTAYSLALGAYADSQGEYTISGDADISIQQTTVVGIAGEGHIDISGGSFLSQNLIIGHDASATGSITITGSGQLTTGSTTIGYYGSGSLTQNNGSFGSTYLYLGYGAGASGEFTMRDSAYAAVDVSYVGWQGTGTLYQYGGNFGSSESLINVGVKAGSVGTIEQSGGELLCDSLYLGVSEGAKGVFDISGSAQAGAQTVYVGYEGVGELNQTGGSFTSASLYVGYESVAEGTIKISGSANVSTGNAIIGYAGVGTLDHSGGSFGAEYLYVGGQSGSTGFVNIGNDAQLTANHVTIGLWGTGGIYQSGGAVSIKDLTLGTLTGSGGLYSISNGSLTVVDMYVGADGAWGRLDITGADAHITITNQIMFEGESYLSAVFGATMYLDAALFYMDSMHPENFQFENLNLIFNDSNLSDDVYNILEIGSQPGALFNANFAFNSIEVNAALALIDVVDNQIDYNGGEVLYVRTLKFGDNGFIDLGHSTIYYYELIGTPQYTNGTLQQLANPFSNAAVPEPSAVLLSFFGFGLLKIFACRSKK